MIIARARIDYEQRLFLVTKHPFTPSRARTSGEGNRRLTYDLLVLLELLAHDLNVLRVEGRQLVNALLEPREPAFKKRAIAFQSGAQTRENTCLPVLEVRELVLQMLRQKPYASAHKTNG